MEPALKPSKALVDLVQFFSLLYSVVRQYPSMLTNGGDAEVTASWSKHIALVNDSGLPHVDSLSFDLSRVGEQDASFVGD